MNLRLPKLVTSDDSLVFGQWLVDDGACVVADERIAEVVAQGVLIYINAPVSGRLIHGNVVPRRRLTVESNLGIVAAIPDDSRDD